MTIRRGLAAAVLALCLAVPAAAAPLFWSTQATPPEEKEAMRADVLAGFPGGVDYETADGEAWLARVKAEGAAGSGAIAVLGGLHGEFAGMADGLADLSGVDASAVLPLLVDLGKLGTAEQKYIPWMQATYLMAANRKALAYLPAGADLDALSYDELIAWAKAVAEGAGGPKFGLPAGPKGLSQRFFEGYLLPAYSGSTVTAFRSEAAVEAWTAMEALWAQANPASTGYDAMADALLAGDVWIAWDHTARLADAFNQRPDDFVAFPAPAGPAGRAFIPVVAGLAVPKSAPDLAASEALIAYLLKPETQVATLKATSFFPVVDAALPEDMPASVRATGAAIAAMAGAPDALPVLLPIGLGERSGDFDRIYRETFERAVLKGEDVRKVLNDEGAALGTLLRAAEAPCWPPDAPSDGPCPVN